MKFIPTLVYAALAVCAAAFAAAQPCPGNLVQNSGFNSNTVIVGDGSMPSSTTDNWTLAYGTPQLQGGKGCGDSHYVSMWGNQFVGEAIQQQRTFTAGRAYSGNVCARRQEDPTKTVPFVDVVLRASTVPLTGPGCPTSTCEQIYATPNITSTSWATFNFACWVPQRNYSYLTISPTNNSNVNDGALTSWANVDNVCIRDITPVITGPSMCITPATYCVQPPATGPFNWTITGGTLQNANASGSCVLVNWTGSIGTLTVESTVNGCKVKSTWRSECTRQPCGGCDINASLTGSQLVSGGAALTFALTGLNPAAQVKATILSASHSVTPSSCGTNGPITATMSATQPTAGPPGWNAPVAPFLSGNQAVWLSNTAAGSPLAPFTMNVALPPPGGGINCNDRVTVCIEFEITTPVTPTQPCRTCTIVRCFTFDRCPSCQ